MCDPVTVAVLGSAGLAGGDVFVSNEDRKARNRAKQEATVLQKKVLENQRQGRALDFKGEQIATSSKLQQLRIDAAKLRAASQAGASKSGVTGLSVDAVLNDFDAQESRASQNINKSLELSEDAANIGFEGDTLRTEGALFNLRKEKFNPVAAALSIGKAAFGAAIATGGGGKGGSGKGNGKSISQEFDGTQMGDA